MQPPETRYTRLGEVSIAYQVLGEGPDMIVVPLFASHLDLMWSEPGIERFIRHASSFARLIYFDMPGTGLSDRVSRTPTLDERVEVIATVLDAVGSKQATICGSSEGGQASMFFAATRPERTNALILYAAYAKRPSARELPEILATIGEDASPAAGDELGRRLDQIDHELDEIVEHWGEGRSIDLVAAPPHSPLERRFWALFERAALSPAGARAALRAAREFDVTEILPSINVPTLILHPTKDPAVPVEAGRYLAGRIPGAKYVETQGAHHGFFFGDVARIAGEMERFLTGASRPWSPDRAFATVLFTDIVGSTERAAELGDARWRELLERHDALVHERVEAAGGRIVKRTGDGFLITFERSDDAIRCAEAISTGADGLGVKVRAGVHSGECELIREDVAGLTVHIGARVAALAKPGEVLVSGSARDLVVQSGIDFADRGAHRLKGVPGECQLFALQSDALRAERSQLRPSAPDQLRRRDRLALRLAGRAPRLGRAVTRMVRWRPRPTPSSARAR